MTYYWVAKSYDYTQPQTTDIRIIIRDGGESLMSFFTNRI